MSPLSVMPRHVSGSRCCEFTRTCGLRDKAKEGIVLLAFANERAGNGFNCVICLGEGVWWGKL